MADFPCLVTVWSDERTYVCVDVRTLARAHVLTVIWVDRILDQLRGTRCRSPLNSLHHHYQCLVMIDGEK